MTDCFRCGLDDHLSSDCPSHTRRRAAPGPPKASGQAAGARPRPPWCGQCDARTRLTDPDAPRRCPACHPLIVTAPAPAEDAPDTDTIRLPGYGVPVPPRRSPEEIADAHGWALLISGALGWRDITDENDAIVHTEFRDRNKMLPRYASQLRKIAAEQVAESRQGRT